MSWQQIEACSDRRQGRFAPPAHYLANCAKRDSPTKSSRPRCTLVRTNHRKKNFFLYLTSRTHGGGAKHLHTATMSCDTCIILVGEITLLFTSYVPAGMHIDYVRTKYRISRMQPSHGRDRHAWKVRTRKAICSSFAS